MAANTESSSTPASSFANILLNEVNNQDIQELLDVQRLLLDQLDKTNEKVDGINKLSTKRYLNATRDFSCHTQMLTTMKSDLDLIFKRIKLLKMRLNKKYPEAYTSVVRMNPNQNNSLDEEDEDINDLTSSSKSATSPALVKSKTIDCSQLSASMRESYSLAHLSSNNLEHTTNPFRTARRFVNDKATDGKDFSTLFINNREE